MPKLKVIYNPKHGIVCPDGLCEEWAKDMCQRGGAYTIGSELLFQYIRLMVKRGVIAPENVEIVYGENDKPAIDKDGRLSHWPKGFCDHFDNTLDELLA